MSSDYVFDELNARRRADFIHAWERSFGRRLDDDVYAWIFNDHNRLFAALSRDEIVAGYGLYPMTAIVQRTMTQALLCNNVFVAPEHQSKMLFSRLGRYALRTAGAGSLLAYGIPNHNAVAGHRRVGWSLQEVPFLARRRASTQTHALSAVAWTQQLPEDALQAIEACSRRSAAGRAFSIVKTAEFARWRYLERPGVRYWFATVRDGAGVSAYAVAKVFAEKGCLHLIDIDGDHQQAIAALIESVDGLHVPYDYVDLWSSTAHRALFEQAGFAPSGQSSTLILIRPTELEGVVITDQLNLVLGDNDVY